MTILLVVPLDRQRVVICSKSSVGLCCVNSLVFASTSPTTWSCSWSRTNQWMVSFVMTGGPRGKPVFICQVWYLWCAVWFWVHTAKHSLFCCWLNIFFISYGLSDGYISLCLSDDTAQQIFSETAGRLKKKVFSIMLSISTQCIRAV